MDYFSSSTFKFSLPSSLSSGKSSDDKSYIFIFTLLSVGVFCEKGAAFLFLFVFQKFCFVP